jgi:hypothetical protein
MPGPERVIFDLAEIAAQGYVAENVARLGRDRFREGRGRMPGPEHVAFQSRGICGTWMYRARKLLCG